MATILNEPSLRRLTQDEVNKLPHRLDPHPLIKKRALLSTSDGKVLGNDIKLNGMQKPIVIHNSLLETDEEDGTEYRAIVVVEGYKRLIAAERYAKISRNKLPFSEFIGTDEELEVWLKRERDIKTIDDTKTKVIKAIEITIPELAASKKSGVWKKHPNYETKMKGLDDLAAKMNGTSRGNIHKAMKIREVYPEVYQAMKITDLTLEDAQRFLNNKSWTPEWVAKVNSILIKNPHPTIKNIIKILGKEIDYEEKKKNPKPQAIKKTNLADCNIDAEIIVKVNRKPNETNARFNKRIERIIELQSKSALMVGHNQIRIITGEVGKGLLDDALKTILVESEKCQEEIKTINVSAPDNFPEEDTTSFKVTVLKPIGIRHKQIIGVKRKIANVLR